MHIEEANLTSISYMHQVHQIGAKLIKGTKTWEVVPASHQKHLEVAINNTGTFTCELPLRHKNIIVTPAFLKKNNIPFATVRFISSIIFVHTRI